MAREDDTISIRSGEELDETALAAYLRTRLPGSENQLRLRQFGGGAANLTYLLDFGSHQYVLRRPPLGPVAPSAHDMGREHRVLSRLWASFPEAPRSFLFCEDPAILGAPFHVLERRKGIVVRRSVPEDFAQLSDAPRKMSLALIRTLDDLHRVDYEAAGLGDLGKPQGFIERQIEGWWGRWQHAKVEDLAAMERTVAWLRENLPAESDSSLVHNDYKLDNLMFAADDPAKIVAVFDWDMCTLGDPLSDLGALLAYWSEPDDPPHFQALSMMPSDGNFLTRRELIDEYIRLSGRRLEDVRFYHALGLFRVAVILAQIYIRYRRGQTKDERFAAFGPVIPHLAQAALDVALAPAG